MIQDFVVVTDEGNVALACIEMCLGTYPRAMSWMLDKEQGLMFGENYENKLPGPLSPVAIFEIAKEYAHTQAKLMRHPDTDGHSKIGYRITKGRNLSSALSIKAEFCIYGK